MDQENNKIAAKAKKDELNKLARLHETAIERQKQQIQKYETGKWKSTTCSVDKLIALATADLQLLLNGRDKVNEEIETLDKELMT